MRSFSLFIFIFIVFQTRERKTLDGGRRGQFVRGREQVRRADRASHIFERARVDPERRDSHGACFGATAKK